uniref:Prolyl endopeptidase n=1 Tax=Sphaeramia orbicularis TaxID=375764 RepID=A0A673BAS0_9TELE
MRLSPQEKYLAATVKTCLREEPRAIFTIFMDHICVYVLGKEWATDDVLFYTTLERLRCSKVFRLDLTHSGSRITSVFEEPQPDVFVEVALSRDQQILSINCNSRTSSEVLLIDKTTQSLEPRLIQPRQHELLYHVEHWKGRLIILTNTGPRKEYQVVQAPLSEPSIVSWVPLFVPAAGTAVRDMDVVGDYCVLTVRTPAGKTVLNVIPLTQSKEVYSIQLPSWACAIETNKLGLAEEHSVLEFLISSPVHPPVQCCLYPEDGFVLSGTEDGSFPEMQGNFITSHLDARSKDGTLVPVTLFHAAPTECLNKAPLLVHVYGAYGRDLNMEFSPEKRLLLEQGWALAYCHIRGGGERGLSWYRQACSEGKHRGVEDLAACLLHLFTSGVSSPSLTALTACSAGAVPVGAMCNRHPHMVKAVTLQAPFLDVLGTMEDPNLPLTLEDREEWGDPVGNPSHRRAISSYCPVHNITPQKYPSMLLTAYSGDTRAPLTGIIRYTEKIQTAIHAHFSMHQISESERAPNIVLNVRPGANHLGPEDFDVMVEEVKQLDWI